MHSQDTFLAWSPRGLPVGGLGREAAHLGRGDAAKRWSDPADSTTARPWSSTPARWGKREEIIALTGGPDVPVLVLDDGSTVAGSGAIVAWVKAHPA
ncbi:MAG TPA: glutathione S-transferase N-terminal domain-containing protein [Solirubrobacteraceae bacterium]|nr:glutathione S-transferase N-terminal domain-containing protein [Solirubrobacteraceae bacterium]